MSTADSNWISPVEQLMSAGRLPYDDNQYSPFNPSGQRKYSNFFMNSLRDFMGLEERLDGREDQGLANAEPFGFLENREAKPRFGLAIETTQTLPYALGQYSPNNPNGRRRYSNEFLKAVCRSMTEDFEGMHLNKSDIGFESMLQYDDDQQYRPSTKSGRKKYSCRFLKALGSAMACNSEYGDLNFLLNERSLFPWDLGGYNKMSRQSRDRAPNEPSEASHEELLNDLKTVENPWRPELAEEKLRDITFGKLRPDRLVKMLRGYLNKLTPQNSDNIINQIAMLPLDANDAMNLANLLFEKAVNEPKYSRLYAKVCFEVVQIQDLVAAKCIDIMNSENPYEGLNIDTLEGEILQEPRASRRLALSEGLYELMRQRRARHINAIKLVGELYKLGVLKLDLILKYIVKFTDTATNESIEFVCGLLYSVGADLASKTPLAEFLETLMTTLCHYSGDKVIGVNLDARVKFKVMDTLEMSERNWRPRLSEEEPKTIDEIRREFASAHSGNSNSKSRYPKSSFDDPIDLISMLDL